MNPLTASCDACWNQWRAWFEQKSRMCDSGNKNLSFLAKASLEGFEPTTRCLEGSRSVQLSYRDKLFTIQM